MIMGTEHMVKIVVKFHIRPECVSDYLRDLKVCLHATRQEPGCLEYEAFWNGQENVCTLFECFQDSAAAARHLEYPHFSIDFKALKKYYSEKPVAERFEGPAR